MTHKIPHRSGAKGPDELRQQIEHTRSQLGDTVAQLMDRADVKGRARARAADLRDKAGAMTVQLRASAAQAGHAVQDKAARTGHVMQGRATHAGHLMQDRVAHAGHAVQDRASRAGHVGHHRAGHAGHGVQDAVPQPLRGAVRAGMRHPGPVIAVGVLGAAAVAAGVVWSRRRCH
ncbi:DUF3618 domain-containing protein [Streptomyces sp. AF1A]|jgi:hypothetical protein|uniref:DUF3618 domain-containing protein n=1 Tax=Streptomyces sp. AF1A TaxID=3394350 RepID=UPI0039BC877F